MAKQDIYILRNVKYDGSAFQRFPSGRGSQAVDLTATSAPTSTGAERARLFPSASGRLFPNTAHRQTPRS